VNSPTKWIIQGRQPCIFSLRCHFQLDIWHHLTIFCLEKNQVACFFWVPLWFLGFPHFSTEVVDPHFHFFDVREESTSGHDPKIIGPIADGKETAKRVKWPESWCEVSRCELMWAVEHVKMARNHTHTHVQCVYIYILLILLLLFLFMYIYIY